MTESPRSQRPTSTARLARFLADAPPNLAAAARGLTWAITQAHEAEPFRGTLLRAAEDLDMAPDLSALLTFFSSRVPGTSRSDSRYRWEISHRVGAPIPDYAGDPASWRTYRPGIAYDIERDPFGVEMRLILPMLAGDLAELLGELAEGAEPDASVARGLLEEAAPILRRDLARHVQMNDPWEDTFALWCVARRPRALELLYPIASAIAASYAAGTSGPLLGARHPLFEQPLASASGQLAASLLTLGAELDLVAAIARFLRAAQRPSGGWGDEPKAEDPLITLVVADLLAQVDPTFRAEDTLRYFASCQGEDGMWRAYGPDAPWLTLEILRWAASMAEPFASRFRWPHRARLLRDHKTGLPFFAYFSELSDLFSALPGLASAPAELAFIDLIGFRAFNNRYGQSAGDEVLCWFAAAIERIPHSRAIRDGGDEFLVIGAPCRESLERDIDEFRKSWPAEFRSHFHGDAPPVAPRIIIGSGNGSQLRTLREQLGQDITALKHQECGEDGILVIRPPEA